MGSKEKDKCKLLCWPSLESFLVQMWGEKKQCGFQVSHEGNAHVCKYAGDND